MVNSLNKLGLLLWKNWLLQSRHKIQTLFEILIPILFTALLVLVRSLVVPEKFGEVHFPSFSPYNASGNVSISLMGPRMDAANLTIPYAPNTNLAREIVLDSMVDFVVEYLKIQGQSVIPAFMTPLLSGRLRPFNSSEELFTHMGSPLYLRSSSLCGISLGDNFPENSSELSDPLNADVTLHFPSELRTILAPAHLVNWRTDLTFPPFPLPGPRSPYNIKGGIPGYTDEGFTGVAASIMNQLTKQVSQQASEVPLPSVKLQRLPHPPYLHDPLIIVLKGFLPFIMMISFIYTSTNIVKAIAIEKELQLKEVMKVMGLKGWLHWVAWFIKSFSYLFIAMCLITLLCKVQWYRSQDGTMGYSVISYTPWHFLLFYLLMYSLAIICFCFMMSVFFSKATIASAVSGVVWFLSFAPHSFLSSPSLVRPFAARMLASLSFNTAISFGFEIIMNYEVTTQGLQWSKIWEPSSLDDPLVMGHILLMLLLDSFIYLIIALYVEQILPGSYGVPQPWYFPFTASYWCPGNKDSLQTQIHSNGSAVGAQHVESQTTTLETGISIKELTKVFNGTAVVDRLSLDMYQDQITVLLGHNGAGKTTTMSMLTGILTPTSGTAVVAGHDILHDMRGVRSSLGLCPQHNVLFTDLTVEEHVAFYARLKGMQGGDVKREVDKYVKLIGLQDKAKEQAGRLSGGMQRRLSVGVAMCGGSRVVLLDEPSSGIDPASRRELWDFLQADKAGRTVVMSTHFMDEAEVLGDRVAVLAGGRVRAVGSPFYLKQQYNVGYTLTATTSHAVAPTKVAPQLTKLIKEYVPDATIASHVGSELSYHLPAKSTSLFPPLLQRLESSQAEHNINSYGISAGSLVDVFMKVGADAVETLDENDQLVFKEMGINGTAPYSNLPRSVSAVEEGGAADTDRLTGAALTWMQWGAMFQKRLITSSRAWILSVLQALLPLLLLVLAVLIMRMFLLAAPLPRRALKLSQGYGPTETWVSRTEQTDETTTQRVKAYMAQFKDANMAIVDIGQRNVSEYYLEQARNNSMADMRKRNLVAATFAPDEITVWFSAFSFHDQPISLALVYNAVLGALSLNSSISLINQPLPYSIESQVNLSNDEGFNLSMNMGFSMVFIFSFIVMFYVKENVSKSKLLQLVSGASPSVLWSAAFVFDFLYYLLISLLMAITLLLFQQNTFTTAEQIVRFLLLCILFGVAMLPLHYLASMLFQSPASGFTRMLFFNIFTGIASFIIIRILAVPDLDLEDVSVAMHWTFLIVPLYAFTDALRRHMDCYNTVSGCHMICDKFFNGTNCNLSVLCKMSEQNPQFKSLKMCCIPEDPYFSWSSPGLGSHMVFMLVSAVVLFIILALKEYRVFDVVSMLVARVRRGWGGGVCHREGDEDSDVASEREKVSGLTQMQLRQYNLVCKEVCRLYKDFAAVKSLSFCVGQGECFGLLGINGAGKTSTFKMLTGDLALSGGDALVQGYSIRNQVKQVHSRIGYCPQFDGLLDEMTGRETLEMFCSLKGIPQKHREAKVWSLVTRLGFLKHLDKKVREYSGGNKRKLSTAIALLGGPRVVYLDEPTTGMDPLAKRQVWRLVGAQVGGQEGGSVVLTSHSMEECEALCTRLAIMVNGSFHCLGSIQHLKNKFSQGCTLIVKLKPLSEGGDSQAFQDFLYTNFPGIQLKESYQRLYTYFLPSGSVSWASVFGLLEQAKSQHPIEDYSVGQTSLEQIFLQFAQHQAPEQH